MGVRKASKSTRPKKQPTPQAAPFDMEQALVNAAVLAQKLGQKNQQSSGQTMVGVRNVSDLTVGVPGAFGQPDIHLHAAFNRDDPTTWTVIPYAWWRQLRSGALVDTGVLIRDDSVIGDGYVAAPPDRPEELAVNHSKNVVVDPRQWIESRNESQVRADIAAMTSLNSLRRLRRAVDDKLRAIVNSIPDEYRDMTPAGTGRNKYVPPKGWDNRHKMALEQLPAIYRLVDDLTTRRIEGAD